MDRNLTTGLVFALGSYALVGWQVAGLHASAPAVQTDPDPVVAEVRSFDVPPLRPPPTPPPPPEDVVHELPSATPPPAAPPPRAAKRKEADAKPVQAAQKAIENPDPAPGGDGPTLVKAAESPPGPAAPVLDAEGQGGGQSGVKGQGQGDKEGSPDGDPNAVYGANVVDVAPKLVSQPAPDYPEWALRDGATARFLLTFVVGADGKPRDMQVHCVRGACDLADSIRKVAKHWRFSPGIKAGKPVATRVSQEFTFTIEAEE